MPLASRKARSVFSQRRNVSGLTPAAVASWDLVYDFIFYYDFSILLHLFFVSRSVYRVPLLCLTLGIDTESPCSVSRSVYIPSPLVCSVLGISAEFPLHVITLHTLYEPNALPRRNTEGRPKEPRTTFLTLQSSPSSIIHTESS